MTEYPAPRSPDKTEKILVVEKTVTQKLIPWPVFFIIIGLIASTAFLLHKNRTLSGEKSQTQTQIEATEQFVIDEDLYIETTAVGESVQEPPVVQDSTPLVPFPDISIRYLDEGDLAFLDGLSPDEQAQLLQTGINSIYAVNHYRFENEDLYRLYSGLDWYDGYLTMEDARAEFNSFESYNADYLVEQLNTIK